MRIRRGIPARTSKLFAYCYQSNMVIIAKKNPALGTGNMTWVSRLEMLN